jgi:glutamate dehydrogenase/leucine dehydrogenase
MSLKTALVNIPLGGGKGGIAVDPRSLSLEQLEELSRKYVAQLVPHIGPHKDVPAPDVNTNPRVIDWMVDEYERLTGDTTKASFTGKSLESGGSKGRDAATGRGGAIVLHTLRSLQKKANEPLTYALQGFGNVGAYFAEIAETEFPHWKLVGATDSSGGVSCLGGLSSSDLVAFKQEGKKLIDYNIEGGEVLAPDDIIELNVDVLICAALGGVVTAHNQHTVKASYILELANGPVDSQAEEVLFSRGVTVVPDILANAGGVIVSYLEWLQNLQGQRWTLEKVNKSLTGYLEAATKDVVFRANKDKTSLKDASFSIAIERLVGAQKSKKKTS